MRVHDNALETEWSTFLARARLANGIQQNFVAHKLGVAPAVVGQWENYDRTPGAFRMWNKWASFFGVGPVSPYRRLKHIEALTAARKTQGLSMRAISERIGVSKERLCQWERRKGGPATFRLWNTWAEALGLEPIINMPPKDITLLFGINGELTQERKS